MNPYCKSWIRPLMVGLVIAVLRFVGHVSDATAATLPKDPCTLLKPAEVQAALAPKANIGSGIPETSRLPLAVICTYKWGPRTREWGDSTVTVMVIDASQAWPDLSPDLIEQGVLMEVIKGGPNASQIPGVSDAAVFTYNARRSEGTAEAYLKAKGVHLSVRFHEGDALQKKDKVIELLKRAAARL